MKQYVTTPAADEDMFQIALYIAHDNLEAALRQIDKFEAAFDKLGEFPGIGRSREELGSNLRSYVIGKYVVFYREMAAGVEIVRVIHGARDIEKQF